MGGLWCGLFLLVCLLHFWFTCGGFRCSAVWNCWLCSAVHVFEFRWDSGFCSLGCLSCRLVVMLCFGVRLYRFLSGLSYVSVFVRCVFFCCGLYWWVWWVRCSCLLLFSFAFFWFFFVLLGFVFLRALLRFVVGHPLLVLVGTLFGLLCRWFVAVGSFVSCRGAFLSYVEISVKSFFSVWLMFLCLAACVVVCLLYLWVFPLFCFV